VHGDVVLPAFEMDCRDWLVATPDEAGLPEEVEGAPLLAVLSSAVVDEGDLQSVSAVITVGLLDEDAPLAVPLHDDCVAAEVVDGFDDSDDDVAVRYIVPAPDGQLALLAEFSVRTGAGVSTGSHGRVPTDPELSRRIEALMSSFRWAA
jgi:hypothetical protein